MPPPKTKKPPKRDIDIDCGRYRLRTAKAADASDQWAAWMADPEAVHMLNAPAQMLTKDDIATYIKQFDQRSHILIGIFEKEREALLGILRVDIDFANSRCLVSLLIGDPQHRNAGVTNAVTVPFRDYFFETVGLQTMLATALARNKPITHYLFKSGWTLDKTLPGHVKSHADGAMLDLCFFSLTRDAWREWKRKNVGQTDERR